LLHLETVAEGVEDEKSLTLLREWGCDHAQGFAVHRPSPPEQLVEWIERNAHGNNGSSSAGVG
jgi:c-di-GMP phosphodiesterase